MLRTTLALLSATALMAPAAAAGPGAFGDGGRPLLLAQAQPGAGMPPQRMLQMLDQDGDGALSRAEFVETPRPGARSGSPMAEQNRAARFEAFDVDGDGLLDADELADLASTAPAGRQAQPGAGRGAGMGGSGGGGMSQARMLQMLDQDGDGALSHAEFVETPRPGAMANSDLAERNRAARFDQLDVDGDGLLDADELAELPANAR